MESTNYTKTSFNFLKGHRNYLIQNFWINNDCYNKFKQTRGE